MPSDLSALDNAWTVLKYDDYDNDDDDRDIMDDDDYCPCSVEGHGYLQHYSNCQCPVACRTCTCHDRVAGREELNVQEERKERISEQEQAGGRGVHDAAPDEGLNELDMETKPVGEGRSYEHLDPNTAGWHREMDRRASAIPDMYLEHLRELYERHQKAFAEGDTQAMQDVAAFADWEEGWNKWGGLDRIGELLSDKEAIERIAEQVGGKPPEDGGGLAPIREEEPSIKRHPSRVMTDKQRQITTEGPRVAVRRSGTRGRTTTPYKREGGTTGYVLATERAHLSGASSYLGGTKGGATTVTGAAAANRVGAKPSEVQLAEKSHHAQQHIGRKMARAMKNMDEGQGSWEPHDYLTDEEGNLIPSAEIETKSGKQEIIPADAIERPSSRHVKVSPLRIPPRQKMPLPTSEVEEKIRARSGTESDRLRHDLGLPHVSAAQKDKIRQQLTNPANYPDRHKVEGFMPWPVDLNIPPSIRGRGGVPVARYPDSSDQYVERVMRLLNQKKGTREPRHVMTEEEIAEHKKYLQRIGWSDE